MILPLQLRSQRAPRPGVPRLRAIALALALLLAPGTASAQLDLGAEPARDEASAPEPEPIIETADTPATDAAIAERLEGIFAEIEPLAAIAVRVDSGVVTLSGSVTTRADIERAERIAERVSGVVTVENRLERNLEVAENLDPLAGRVAEGLAAIRAGLPLLGIALAIVALFWLAGSALARLDRLWRAITPNAFLAELVATSVRVVVIIAGLIVALDLLEAGALLGALLGSAGVIGLAVGFAIRDTVDNYVSSIMLSVRQPFRANDHVVIGTFEGRVIRLTSRATILMTLDGNHLRIPNSTVFKSEILNYTTNPQRRVRFSLGVDAEDDPVAAIATGLARLNTLPFVLSDPAADAWIIEVGDSNIVIEFTVWIDQTHTSFLKARTGAIAATKQVLEQAGFALPEPIYRLRFDSGAPLEIASHGEARETRPHTRPRSHQEAQQHARPRAASEPGTALDTSADTEIARKVAEERERGHGGARDILDDERPLE
ncbi:MAG: mechanosensitive ion channel domain-containing protein [Erythrobacter sp.]|nr:mechanosensitive ion channel domain-containing protein [Erythrobacter sp.]